MYPARDRALTLAHEAEAKDGCSPAEAVVNRARVYLDFLEGTRDAEVIDAAREMARKVLS